MKSILKQFFQYIKPIWEGSDNKPSLKAFLAIFLTYNLTSNVNFAVRKWSEGKSLSDLALVLGILASLIAALVGATAYFNYMERKLNQTNPPNQNGEQAPGE